MSYEDDNGDFESSADSVYLDDASLDEEENITEDDSDVQRGLKIKDKNPEHALEVRRAIEDHIERSRLQKDLDYLFDEHFTEDED